MSDPKRTARISPDRPWVGGAAIILVLIVMLSSMVFSYVGIAEAAEWTGVPVGIHAIAPIFIDGAIITYTVSLTIHEWRREDRKTVNHTRRVLWGFTILSVGLNFAHTAAFWGWDFSIREAWFGSLISVAAPVAALLSAEEVVRLTFRRQVDAAVTVDAVAELAVVDVPGPGSAPEGADDLFTLAEPAEEPAAPEPVTVPVPHGEVLIARDVPVPSTGPVPTPDVTVAVEGAHVDPVMQELAEAYDAPAYDQDAPVYR